MKKLSILFFTVCIQSLFGTTYYVSNAGNDAANGTSTATSWATLFRIHRTAYAAGDSVLIKRGDTFEGQILDTLTGGSPASPVVIGAYGSGAKPIIHGDLRTRTWIKIAGRTGYYKAYLGGYSEILFGYFQWVSGAWSQSGNSSYRDTDPSQWEAFLDAIPAGGFGTNYEHDTLFVRTFSNVTFPATRDSIRIYRHSMKIDEGSHDFIVRDLDIRNFSVCFAVYGSTNAKAIALSTLNGNAGGIRFTTTVNSLVDSCVVDSCAETGIYLVQANNTVVKNNTIKNVLETIDGGIGIGVDLSGVGILDNYAYGGAADTLGYNTVENNIFNNIFRGFTDWFYCIGDTVRNNTGQGAAAVGSPHGENLVMTGNNFTMFPAGGNGSNMIVLGGNIKYSDNILDSIQDYGVWVNGTAGTYTIKNNTITVTTANRTYMDYKTATGVTSDSNAFFGINGKFTKNSINYFTIANTFAATGYEEHSTLNDTTVANADTIYFYYTTNDTVNIYGINDTIQVLVTDSVGVPISGVAVTFARTTAPAGAIGQAITTTQDTTNASGLAETILTLGSKAGNYVVTATSTGVGGSPVTITTNAYRSGSKFYKR